mgnify:CR=1 FL=1|jgi:hypothetical protein
MYYYLGYFIFALLGGMRLAYRGVHVHPFIGLFFLATVLLFGFRYGIGTDYHSYINIFNDITADRGFHKHRLETGYYWLNYAFGSMGLPAQSIIFASFLTTFYFYMRTMVRYSDNYFVSVMVLVCFGLLFQATNVVRQCLAYSICLLSIPYILNRQFLRFFLVVAIAAFLFHRTSLFFLSAYFVILIPRSQLLWYVLFGISIVIYLFTRYVIGMLASVMGGVDFVYAGYFRDLHQITRAVTGMGINLMIDMALFLFVVFNFKHMRDDPPARLFLSLYLLGILMNFAFAQTALLNRFAFYFYYFSFLAMPIILQSIKEGRGKILGYGLFLAYCLLLYTRSAFDEDSSYSNYNNVLMMFN